MEKKSKFAAIVFILLTSTMLLTVLSQNIVTAQDDEATVVVLSSVGGTTNLTPGTYTYPNGETITLIATPGQGFEFLYWIISGNYLPTHNQPPLIIPELYVDDPNWVPDFPQPDRSGVDNTVITQERLDIICGYGYTYTYQPVFTPTELTSPETDAIVIVADAIGGTTSPGPGTYTYPEGQTITLTATPNSGFEFLYWIITGSYTPTHNQPPLLVPEIYLDDPNWVPDFPQPDRSGVDNTVITQQKLDIICGYGYTYTYQPVFTPISADVPQPGDQTEDSDTSHMPLGLSNEALTALIVILVIVVVIAILFSAYIYMKNRR